MESVVSSCMEYHQRKTDAMLSGKGCSSAIGVGQSNNVVMQMGGGCILHICSPGGKGKPTLLDAGEVLEALVDCIFSSRR